MLLNKLLEDGNTLYRCGQLEAASYRYSYALKKLPDMEALAKDHEEVEEIDAKVNPKSHAPVFRKLQVHLLLNSAKASLKLNNHAGAAERAKQAVDLCEPESDNARVASALWSKAKEGLQQKQQPEDDSFQSKSATCNSKEEVQSSVVNASSI